MKKLLYMGYVWPEKTQSAAGVRTWQLLEYFKKSGFKIYFNSGANPTEEPKQLAVWGAEVASWKVNEPGFEEWLSDVQPDLVVFDRYVVEEQFGWRVQNTCPNAIRIIDTQDFHALREFRASNTKGNREESLLDSPNLLRELASYLRSDSVVLISEAERAILYDEINYPLPNVKVIPFIYDWEDVKGVQLRETPQEDKKNFLFIGNFLHEPNCDAVKQLYLEIWPTVFKNLKNCGISAEVHIYGASIPKMISELNQPEKGFRVMGWIPDQYEIISKYRVLLVPLRFGAGLKGKVADAWWSGTAVVSTAIGFEGYGSEIMAEASELGTPRVGSEFVDKAVHAYCDSEFRNLLLNVGQNVLKNKMSRVAVYPEINLWLKDLEFNYLKNRKINWLGRILIREELRSTEYFSKWIQEKNRNNEQN